MIACGWSFRASMVGDLRAALVELAGELESWLDRAEREGQVGPRVSGQVWGLVDRAEGLASSSHWTGGELVELVADVLSVMGGRGPGPGVVSALSWLLVVSGRVSEVARLVSESRQLVLPGVELSPPASLGSAPS